MDVLLTRLSCFSSPLLPHVLPRHELHVLPAAADAHFEDAGVNYACIAGCSVRGNGRAHRRAISRYSFSAYMQVRGHVRQNTTATR